MTNRNRGSNKVSIKGVAFVGVVSFLLGVVFIATFAGIPLTQIYTIGMTDDVSGDSFIIEFEQDTTSEYTANVSVTYVGPNEINSGKLNIDGFGPTEQKQLTSGDTVIFSGIPYQDQYTLQQNTWFNIRTGELKTFSPPSGASSPQQTNDDDPERGIGETLPNVALETSVDRNGGGTVDVTISHVAGDSINTRALSINGVEADKETILSAGDSFTFRNVPQSPNGQYGIRWSNGDISGNLNV